MTVFPLKSGNLIKLSSYFYFSVEKKSSASLKAYGDYAHANNIVPISLAQYNVSGSNGITLGISIMGKYEKIGVAIATY